MDYIFMPKVHLPAKKKWLKIFVCLRQLRVSIIVNFFYTTKKQNLTGDILSVSLFCCFYNNNKKKFVDVCIVQQTHHALIKLSVFFLKICPLSLWSFMYYYLDDYLSLSLSLSLPLKLFFDISLFKNNPRAWPYIFYIFLFTNFPSNTCYLLRRIHWRIIASLLYSTLYTPSTSRKNKVPIIE
jgi:hypothetical protein